MAGRNFLREGAPQGESDDPFAELTRIIGFDPRVKVGEAASAPAGQARAAGRVDPAAAGTAAQAEPDWESEFSDLDFDLDPGAVRTRSAAPGELQDVASEAEQFALELEEDLAAAMFAEQSSSPSGIDSNGEAPAAFGPAAEAGEPSLSWARAEPWEPESGKAKDAVTLGETAPDATASSSETSWPEWAPGSNSGVTESKRDVLDIDLDAALATSIELDLEQAWPGEQDQQPAATAKERNAAAVGEPTSDPDRDNWLTSPQPAVNLGEDQTSDFESELAALLNDDAADISGDADDVMAAALQVEPGRSRSPAVEPEFPIQTKNAGDADGGEPEGPSAELPSNVPAQADVRQSATETGAEDDPFAALAAMAARYRAAQFTPAPPRGASAPAHAAASQNPEQAEVEEMKRHPSAKSDMPDIETVDVPEHAVALEDDLDLPETPYDEPRNARSRMDDVDAEFNDLLQEMSGAESTRRPEPAYARSAAYHQMPDARYSTPARQPSGTRTDWRQTAQPVAADDRFDRASAANEPDWDLPGSYADAETDIPVYAEDEADEMPAASRPRKKAKWFAALFGSVALVALGGAAAMKFTGAAETGGPVLIHADAGPTKVRPDNPGGTVVPNQENEVYERVAGMNAVEPAQPKLLSSAEEPVSLDEADEEDALPGLELGAEEIEMEPSAKAEDRVEEAADVAPAAEESIAVTPRKVKTMVVKADGTLAAREEAPVVENLVANAGTLIETVKKGSTTVASADVDLDESTASVTPDPQDAAEASPISASADDLAAKPAVTATTTEGWSVQIASQPSEAAARSSYADLARRFGGVLGGHDVAIVKAEVAGKGTFWRVRVPAETRSAAVNLCTSYKSAGGNCFVSK